MSRRSKIVRFAWRAFRNVSCAVPGGRRVLFARARLAERFGASDANYAIDVFLHHYEQLVAAGFEYASTILEIGPGRNLGTALLMWAVNESGSQRGAKLLLWDVFPNMSVDSAAIRETAATLLASKKFIEVLRLVRNPGFHPLLQNVRDGRVLPDIRYDVRSLQQLLSTEGPGGYELIYSHAVIEHVWKVAEFWRATTALTKTRGWHSHRIDLADHGDRSGNYLEMLEWSPISYWITMRFIPGAVNRWRAATHLRFAASSGLAIVSSRREARPDLPGPKRRLYRSFRHLPDDELKTTALDLVARKN